MTEADKDALLVRAAIDIMAFQSKVANLEAELKELRGYRALVEKWSSSLVCARRRPASFSRVTLHRAMVDHVVNMFDACEGNVEKTAEVLNVHKSHVYRYLPARLILGRVRDCKKQLVIKRRWVTKEVAYKARKPE